MTKRILSILLTLALVLSMIPAVFAEKIDFDKAIELQVNTPTDGQPHTAWYKFCLDEPGYVSLTMDKKGSSSLPDVELYNEDNICLAGDSSHNSPMGLAAGTYYIYAYRFSASKNYTMTVNFTPADDWEQEYNSSAPAANGLTQDKPVHGVLTTYKDEDYYRFTLDKSGFIQVTFKHPYIKNSNSYWKVNLQNEALKTIGRWNIQGDKTETVLPLVGLEAGTYYLYVKDGNYSTDTQYEMSYSFTGADNWETEWNNDYDTADELIPGTPVHGTTADDNDLDYYVFRLDKTGCIRLSFNHKIGKDKDTDWRVSLMDENHDSLRKWNISEAEKESKLTTMGLEPGTYYLCVEAGEYDWWSTEYELNCDFSDAETWETETNDDQETADPLELGSAIHGAVAYESDVDYYNFQLKEKGYIQPSFKHKFREGNHSYWTVTIQDESRTNICSCDIRGDKPETLLPCLGLDVGNYFICVEGNSGTWWDTDYELAVKFTKAEDWETEKNNDIDTADDLVPGSVIHGVTMSAADEDFYRFQLQEDGVIHLNFDHKIAEGSDPYWTMYLLDENGESMVRYRMDNKVPHKETDSIGLGAGTYFVKVVAYHNGWTDKHNESPYDLSVTYTQANDWETEPDNDNFEHADALEINVPVKGSMKYEEDEDFYSFSLTKETEIYFYFQHKILTDSTEWKITLYDENMQKKTTYTSQGKSPEKLLGSILLEAGNYYVKVEAGSRFSYTDYTFTVMDHEDLPEVDASKLFIDVHKKDWFYSAINYVVAHELFGGTGPNTFDPNLPMNRAMLVTVLWRFEGKPKEGTNLFVDVPSDQWYTEPVAWASSHGIVNGVGNNCFNPEGQLTREQMAAILFRYAAKKGYSVTKQASLGSFPDGKKVMPYALIPVKWAVGEKLIGGSVHDDNIAYLDPQGSATRAQVATIFMRFVQNIAGK